jgi:hypothetical protein
MDIKSILVICGCVWGTIIVALASWYGCKWLVTEGLLLGAVRRLLKLTAIATLLLFCFSLYSFIGYYTYKHKLIPTVVESIKKEYTVSVKHIT